MNDVIRASWAVVDINADFISIQTCSGYRGPDGADPKGAEYLLPPEINDEELGLSVLDALARSRFLLPAPRQGVWVHPEVTYDMETCDYRLIAQRHTEREERLMAQYGYKTKRALYKDMRHCSIERKNNQITIQPWHHVKLDAWDGEGISENDHVVIPATSSAVEVGAAVRVALSRCTG